MRSEEFKLPLVILIKLTRGGCGSLSIKTLVYFERFHSSGFRNYEREITSLPTSALPMLWEAKAQKEIVMASVQNFLLNFNYLFLFLKIIYSTVLLLH